MINYANGITTREYSSGNKKLYATFHPEVIVERADYEKTGRYLVVLLHPQKGLQSFFLNKNDETGEYTLWEDDPAIVEDDLLKWCNQQIASLKN